MAAKQGNRVRGSDVAARERLLKSATGLFTRKGYSGTTVREIVAAAGVTKPVLYYYFRNKEGIYLELMRGGFSRFDSLLGESVAAWGTVSERLTRLCIQTFSLFVDHIDVARVMYAIYYGPPQGAPFIDFDAYHRKFQDVVRRLIREGIRRGEFEKGNVDDMMWAIIGAVNVASESLLCQPGDALGRKDLERVLRIIYRGIAATGGSRTPRGKGGGK
ncbi:MAG: TetR/AcrR family transcriptional regulator [Candidatus Deferrimicrobiaceae bacterium]